MHTPLPFKSAFWLPDFCELDRHLAFLTNSGPLARLRERERERERERDEEAETVTRK